MVVEEEMKVVGNLLTDPQAIVEDDDEALSASATGSSFICDDFNNRNELGTDWFDDTFNTLQIQDDKIVRDISVPGWQYATYGAVSYKPEEPLATVSVTDFDPLVSDGSLGVALSLNAGGADLAPALVLVSDFLNDQVYVVCSYANGESAWGNVVVSLEGDRNALGSSFTLEASMDVTTGEMQMRVTDIGVGSPYVGKSVRFPCGVFPNHDSGDFGNMAGIGIFASNDKFTVAVDDFGHSGCLDDDEEEEVEPDACGTCSGSLVSNGVAMRRFFRGTCISVCVPARLKAAAESLVDAECGTCNT